MDAILIQEGKVIYYASRALTEAKQCHFETEKETLAVAYIVEDFQLV